MSKLTFSTKPPKKGNINHESFMTHVDSNSRSFFRENYPSQEIQAKAHRIVGDAMHGLIKQLKELGYDETKARFSIHFEEK